MTALLGLLGKAGAGKDTLAAHLIDEHGWRRVAFADAIKHAAYNLDPIVHDGDRGGLGYPGLQQLVNVAGWEGAKTRPDVRRLLQRLGVAIRDLDEDFWTSIAMRRAATVRNNGISVVVTDVRFPNEVKAIRWAGGKLARIIRPDAADLGENGQHVSETAVDDTVADYTVRNTRDLDWLRFNADILAEDLAAA